ncbi:MAG: hypothetical protein HYS14_08430 [Candidatus Rokubacteria bacterium]|nr:hypothetical protein [Candidatus Rokubacteria bacterium]
MKTPRAWVVPALLLTVLIWGCVYSSIKYVQQGIPPTELATFRAVSVILGQELLTVPLFVGAGAVIAGVTLTRLG